RGAWRAPGPSRDVRRWRPHAARRRRRWRAGSRIRPRPIGPRRQRAGCLLASGAAGRLPLVVGIVSAAGVVIREPQLLVLLVFHLEIRRLQPAQQPRSALDRVAAGLLEPVRYRVAAVIVNNFPAGGVPPTSAGRPPGTGGPARRLARTPRTGGLRDRLIAGACGGAAG